MAKSLHKNNERNKQKAFDAAYDNMIIENKENATVKADKRKIDIVSADKKTEKGSKDNNHEQKAKTITEQVDASSNVINKTQESDNNGMRIEEKNVYNDEINDEEINDEIDDEKTANIKDEKNKQKDTDEYDEKSSKNTKKHNPIKHAAQKKVVDIKKYNIEKILDSGKIINIKKGELKHLISAKNQYKTEVKASLIKKKKEIFENLKKENEKTLAMIPKNIQACPYICFLIGMKNNFAGNKIIAKSKFDNIKKKPSVMIKIGNETIVIDEDSLDKQKIVGNGHTNLTFVNKVKSLYEDYFGKKKIKK